MVFIRDEDFEQPRPRIKRTGILGPAPKKRRSKATGTTPQIPEVTFDTAARSEYLTGFHKRKVARQKLAQAAAAAREKEEKLAFRKQLREERKKQVEEHVRHVESLLTLHDVAGAEEEEEEEWNGCEEGEEEQDKNVDPVTGQPLIDEEEEYVDEDRFTTVKIESVTVTRDGLEKPGASAAEAEAKREAARKAAEEAKANEKPKKVWPKKDKKNKFRYENKIERTLDRAREQSRNRAKRAKFTNKE